ncbi:MAG: c-type cytochrome biogenesis protein CcmI [Paracoccaceae bacterium]
MVFWITAAALTAAVAGFLIAALMRARADAEHPAAYDLRVYRDQLKEVDRDLARGIITPGDADRIRAEVGRRVLSADAQLQKAQTGTDQPRGATLALAGIVVAALLGGGFALYPVLGQPGARDLPLEARIEASDETRTDRMSQAEAEAKLPPQPATTPQDPKYAELIEKLRTTVKDRPDDLQGQLLLVRNEAALGNYKPAYEAQAAVIRIKGASASADDYAVLAELMISTAGGYVSPQAEDALRAALQRDPRHQPARYYTGLMMIQIDRPDIAFRLWRDLLEEGPESAPWIPVIRDRIGELAFRAGVDYSPPAPQATPPMGMGLPGPNAQDMANAAEMTPEERQEMIQGMVGRLNDKLASEGGSAQEWARLIGALGVLGETDRAAAIWAEAQKIFADKPDLLAVVRGGAAQAGLLDPVGPRLRPGPGPGANAGPARPSAQDMQNAAEMTPEERQDMIRGMVSNLAERLASDGGTAQEWARLVTSQARLGDRDAALKSLSDARAALAGDAAGLAALNAAAASVGLGE